MSTFFLVLALVLLAAWVFAEFKARTGARLTLGLAWAAMLVFSIFLNQVESAVITAKTLMYYDHSLALVSALIERGHGHDVVAAVERHQASVAAKHGHLTAASELRAGLVEAFSAIEKEEDKEPEPER